MEIVTVRRAGGSLTLTIPRALARSLGLAAGARLAVSAEGDRLVAAPARERRAYTLAELVAACDPDALRSAEDEAWLLDPPRGSEAI